MSSMPEGYLKVKGRQEAPFFDMPEEHME
jgi:hypothetical protein